MKTKIFLFLLWFLTLVVLASVAVELKKVAVEKINKHSPELMVVPQENVTHRNFACQHRITRNQRFNKQNYHL